jgi:small subunit ribosomal protein S2
MKQLQAELARGAFDLLPKQEAAGKMAELERLERTLGGMRDMTQLPAAIFIIDPKREQLAVHEARRLNIPVIAVTDTNCDPDDADFLIPANDDAIRAVRLLTAGIADAAIEGQTRYEIAQADREMPAESRHSDFAELFAGDEDGLDLVAAEVGASANGEAQDQI